jgi:hypothetical protein
MKCPLSLKIVLCALIFVPYNLFAMPPKPPANYPQAQYDEDKVPAFALPELLVTVDGQKVTNINTWN